MAMTRRGFIVASGALASIPALAQPRPSFGYDNIVAIAEDLARKPFDDAHDPLPEQLATLDYDAYRNIRFKPEARIALGGAFKLDLFHRGHIFPRRVGVNLLRDGAPEGIPYTPDHFDFGGREIGPFPASTGFAGLRVRFPLNKPGVQDELIVFLGSSYFRFLGRGQLYGLSARGFAINAGVPNEKEEFPFFSEFWIEPSPETSGRLTLYALMDSPSLAGAFSFTLTPGDETVNDVVATIFARQRIERPGVAPLTSMYLTGGSGPRHADLFRREVHDSDGLLLQRDGATTWRPLRNPRVNRITSYRAGALQGFGLMQRNRDFDDYQDLEASYERRPSYFVEPANEWGPGSIALSELTTDSEIHDNIVATFRPQEPLEAGSRSQWRYRITAAQGDTSFTSLGRAMKTLISDRAAQAAGRPEGARLYIVDFAGGDLSFYQSVVDELELALHTTTGAVSAEPLQWNPNTKGVRARIYAFVDLEQTTEISAALLHRGKPLSETWLAYWYRDPLREQEPG